MRGKNKSWSNLVWIKQSSGLQNFLVAFVVAVVVVDLPLAWFFHKCCESWFGSGYFWLIMVVVPVFIGWLGVDQYPELLDGIVEGFSKYYSYFWRP